MNYKHPLIPIILFVIASCPSSSAASRLGVEAWACCVSGEVVIDSLDSRVVDEAAGIDVLLVNNMGPKAPTKSSTKGPSYFGPGGPFQSQSTATYSPFGSTKPKPGLNTYEQIQVGIFNNALEQLAPNNPYANRAKPKKP
jgi:hypothetical protein